MASDCGCHKGDIENGFVATTSCKVYSSSCNIYCPYYCHDGYVKTASTVYCAGNERWVPTGSHPTQIVKACKNRSDPVHDCDSIFFDNGYIVSCPVSSPTRHCFYRCYSGYKQASETIYCTKDGWITTSNNSSPCLKDGTYPTTSTNRPRTTPVTMPTPPQSTYRGYYDDPNLKMDISPVIFVGAVIGGIVLLALLIFAIFFRAHRKSSREVNRRTAFLASCDPFSQQNDNSNHQDNCPVDDSEFRDIARRIINRSSDQQQHNLSSPPPYEAYTTANSNANRIGNEPFIGPPSQPYTVMQSPGTAILASAPYQSFENQETSPYNPNTNAIKQNTVDGTGGLADNPPPYESLQIERRSETSTSVKETYATDQELELPPPYTTHEIGDSEI